MFRASLCPSSGEQRPCVTACGVLRWFCCMWLVAVVGRCLVGRRRRRKKERKKEERERKEKERRSEEKERKKIDR